VTRWEALGADEALEPRLDERIVEVLAGSGGSIAFNGLRRTLSAHPESLSRALRRLERYGRVERTAQGYRLLELAAEALPPGFPVKKNRGREPDDRPLAELRLAPDLPASEVLGRLAGRWFGPLRWVGIFDRPGEPRLVWSRADGSGQVSLGVREGVLRVYGGRTGDGVPGDEDAARELLAHALQRLGGPRGPSANGIDHGALAFGLAPDRFVLSPN
jgi:hypothetical protein